MKLVLPLAAALLLWPPAAGAQGYSGVMPPQQGYRTPPPAAAPPVRPQGGDFGSPYSGTGASDNTGYMSTTDIGGAAAGDMEAAAEVAPEPLGEEEGAIPPTSAFAASFAPAEKDDDGAPAGTSIYDTVNANTGTAAERRRKAVVRKVQAAQKKAQREVERMNEERARQSRAMVQKTIDDMRRKEEGEEEEFSGGDEHLDKPSPEELELEAEESRFTPNR